MSLINCEITLDLTWYKNYVNAANQETAFSINDKKLTKVLQQLKLRL